MNEKLLWRRQFILAREPLQLLSAWKHFLVGRYHLYGHPDLEINATSDSKRTVVLIGYLFDSVDTQKGNIAILTDILARTSSVEDFIPQLKPYAGRYVAIYHDDYCCAVVHDAFGLREVYYCTKPNLIVCGSQPNLLVQFADPEIKVTSDPAIKRFYTIHFKNAKWVGDDTYFENVKHLLPNHYLDVNKQIAFRYWPRQQLRPLRLDQAVSESCNFLQGIMRAVIARQPVMLAVTAGIDSRTLLAASRRMASSVYFFINKERDLTDRSPDVRVSKAIFRGIGLPFHVHVVADQVDPRFRKVFLQNAFLASDRILPTIYNVYFKNHAEKLNILGTGEIGRSRYGKQPRRLTGHRMAYALGYKDSDHVIKTCERLLPDLLFAGKKSGVNVMTLLYWEQTKGNSGAVGNSESDIAMEEFDPYNSHRLNEILLAVSEKYTRYINNILFTRIIGKMWPELLQWPINPPEDSIQAHLAFLLKRIGAYSVLTELRYWVNRARYAYAFDYAG